MNYHRDADLADFAGHALPWLQREPVLNNVMCSLVDARLSGRHPIEADGIWIRILDQSEHLVGAAVRTPPHGLLLSAMEAAVAEGLADHLADTAPDLPGANGPQRAAESFAARFAARTGRRSTVGMRTRMFQLDQVVPPVGVEGALRVATPDERSLLVDWMVAFHREATPHEPAGDVAAQVDARLGGRNLLWLWEVDERPVSTAWLTPAVARVVRVSTVYTPPALRGRGYASACTAAASQHALDSGAAACMLYTDQANPTSNKIYQQIGYRVVADAVNLLFTTAG